MSTNCRERTPENLGSQTKTADMMTGSQTTGIHATGIMHPVEVASVGTVGRGTHIREGYPHTEFTFADLGLTDLSFSRIKHRDKLIGEKLFPSVKRF